MLGYGVDELYGLSYQEVICSLDWLQMQCGFQALVKGEQNYFDVQRRDRCKNGSLIWVKSTTTFIQDWSDKTAFFLSIEEEINSQKQSEIQWVESDARFRALFEQVSIGINHIDACGNFLQVNPAFCKILGYTESELLQLNVKDVTHPEDLAQNLASIRQLFAREIPYYAMDKRFIHKNGTPIWTSLHVSVVCDEQGIPKFSVAIVEDISDKQRLEVERQQAEAALKLQAKREMLLHSISQRIRQSLELHEILAIATAEVRQLLKVDRVILCQFNINHHSTVISESVIAPYPPMVGQTLEPQLVEPWLNHSTTRFPLITASVMQGESNRNDAGYTALLQQFSIQSNLVVPIAVNQSPWGFLAAHCCAFPKPWPEWEVDLLKELAEHLAIAIQQSQLYLETRQRAQQQATLTQVIQAIRNSLELSTVLPKAVAGVCDLLGAEQAIVRQLNPDQKQWTPLASYDTVTKTSIRDTPIVRDDDNFIAQSLKHQTILSIKQAQRLKHYDNHAVAASDATGTWLIMPIEINESSTAQSSVQLWGSLAVFKPDAVYRWQDTDTELAQTVVDQIAIAIQQSLLYEKLQQANQELKRLAMMDGLTRIANRRCFDEQLAYEWTRLTRDQAPLGLIFCDIDYFKYFNDTYGHLIGDVCLQQVAEALAQSGQRASDLVARYGGEEFAIILPNTDAPGALQVAEKIRQIIFDLNIPHCSSQVCEQLTVSLGVATMIPSVNDAYEVLVLAADRALYQAKQSGRNRVCLA